MDTRLDPAQACGVARTLQVLDGKWTTLIVREQVVLHAMLRWGRAHPA